MDEKLKKAVSYLVVSGLLFGNALLLESVGWMLKDSYFNDLTLVVLLLFWVGIVWLLIGMGHIIIVMYKFVSEYIMKIGKSN